MKKQIGRILWAAALIALAAVLVFVNLPSVEPELPVGTQVGELLPDFSVECLDGRQFTLSEYRGKTVVINLWATWCAPCVKELPNFDRLLRERSEAVEVLAIHIQPVTADVSEYLSGASYVMPFALDADGSITASVNVSAVLPQTVIVSPEGVVTYNRPGAMSYETLCDLVDASTGPLPAEE